jgi:hypothetical protein
MINHKWSQCKGRLLRPPFNSNSTVIDKLPISSVRYQFYLVIRKTDAVVVNILWLKGQDTLEMITHINMFFLTVLNLI